MPNADKILEFLREKDEGYDDDELSDKLKISPRQQVNQICNRLAHQNKIIRKRIEGKFKNFPNTEKWRKELRVEKLPVEKVSKGYSKDWREFEELARRVMSQYFSVRLTEKNPKGFPKNFDMVSADEDIIGEAKFLTLVHRKNFPSAKMMEITGHVWLLEKADAKIRFLVFGNQRSVPELWLKKYGNLVQNVEFYFISAREDVEKLL